MKKVGLILCLGLLGSFALAQDSRLFEFEGTVYDKTDEKEIETYIVEVYSGNDLIQSPEVDKKGRFTAELFGSGSYIIDISSSGYYPKRIIVHTDIPADVKKLKTFEFEVQLIRRDEYVDIESADAFATSIFDMPYVIFEWDSAIEDLNYRASYTEHIKEKYAEVEDLR